MAPDPNGWELLGEISGPLACLLSIINAFRNNRKTDEDRVKQLEERVNALATTLAVEVSRLESVKEILERVRDDMDRVLDVFRNTQPSGRREKPPSGPHRLE